MSTLVNCLNLLVIFVGMLGLLSGLKAIASKRHSSFKGLSPFRTETIVRVGRSAVILGAVEVLSGVTALFSGVLGLVGIFDSAIVVLVLLGIIRFGVDVVVAGAES